MKLQFPSWFTKLRLNTRIAIGCMIFLCSGLAVAVPLIVISVYRSVDGNPGFYSNIENGEVDIELYYQKSYEHYFRLENVSDDPGYRELEFKYDADSNSWWVRRGRLFWKRFSEPQYTAGVLTVDFSKENHVYINYPSGTWAFP